MRSDLPSSGSECAPTKRRWRRWIRIIIDFALCDLRCVRVKSSEKAVIARIKRFPRTNTCIYLTMEAALLFLFVSSAAFFSGLQCASPGSTGAMDIPTAGFSNISSNGVIGGSSGESGGKKDQNQTIDSRLKRRKVAVDFVVPSLLRYFLAEFVKRPLNGDCQTYSKCYTVRANLKMHCMPLQKIISTFVDPKSPSESAQRNMSSDGQLPVFYKRPLSKVLKLGFRESSQVVVEIGEDMVRAGCGGLSVQEDDPTVTLEMDLTSILEWWLGSGGSRLRFRLMPEKKAQEPGIGDRYAAAIRAADPRLFLQISSQGESNPPHITPHHFILYFCSCYMDTQTQCHENTNR